MPKKKFRIRKPKIKIRNSILSSSSTAAAASPPWTELPRDVTANILQRLGAIEILESAQRVCTTWRDVCKEPSMWRVIDMDSHCDYGSYERELMCRRAVDLSQGQLIEVNIFEFGTDELLRYIAERSSQLRRLKVVMCYYISGKGLSEAVAMFSNLDELHLFFMTSVLAGEHIESIGRACPKLKSFTLNDEGHMCPLIEEEDEYALSIAENMPGLHHLKLFGSKMTNDGLQAILDGCPYLESLDLRHCFNVVLEGNLGQRCSQQIKNLRKPCDSTDDYEWDPQICEDEPSSGDFNSYSDSFSVDDYEDYFHPFGSEYYSDDDAFFFNGDYYI